MRANQQGARVRWYKQEAEAQLPSSINATNKAMREQTVLGYTTLARQNIERSTRQARF